MQGEYNKLARQHNVLVNDYVAQTGDRSRKIVLFYSRKGVKKNKKKSLRRRR